MEDEKSLSSKGRLDNEMNLSIRSSYNDDPNNLNRSRDEKNYKVPIINWAHSPLYEYFIGHRKMAHIVSDEY